MRRIDDENVGPFDELFEDLLGAWRFQIKRHTPLVAIGEVPGVGILGDRLRRHLVGMPPKLAARRLHLDDVGAEVGKNHRSARACDKAREIHHLESGKDVVVRHVCLLSVEVRARLKHGGHRRSVFPVSGKSSQVDGFGPGVG